MTIELAQPTATIDTSTPTPEPQPESHVQDESTQHEAQAGDGESTEQQPKKEKTPEQREIERLRRAIDRKTRQLYEARARIDQPDQRPVTPPQGASTMPASQTPDEPLTLSRAELEKMINERAEKLAPAIRQQQAEIEHRKAVVDGLAKEWGREKFDTLASDLDDAFGGLADRSGRPKPATDAIFESEMPAALIEYLTDPDHADEAEALSHMSDRQAARTVAKLEAKILEAKKAKPQRSNAPAPIENLRGTGRAPSNMPDPGDTKAYIAWANKQERGR